MKPYLCLLSILPKVITGMPTVALETATDIQRIEGPVDWNVAETQYGRRGINGDREVIEEVGSGLRKRKSDFAFFCTETCGTVDVKDCLQAIKKVAPFTSQYCPAQGVLFAPFAGDCVVTIFGHDKKSLCTPSSQIAALAHDVFRVCVNDTADSSGGCEELANGVRVCVRNRKSASCF